MLKTCFVAAALLLEIGCSNQTSQHKILVDVPVSEKSVSVPAPPMSAGVRYIQTFVAPRENLFKIEVFGATYTKRIPSGNLLFHLRDSPTATQDLASGAVPLNEIRDNAFVAFEFAPLAASAGKHYALILDVDNMPPGFFFTLWLTGKDTYPEGIFSVNGQLQPGDAGFRLYSSP